MKKIKLVIAEDKEQWLVAKAMDNREEYRSLSYCSGARDIVLEATGEGTCIVFQPGTRIHQQGALGPTLLSRELNLDQIGSGKIDKGADLSVIPLEVLVRCSGDDGHISVICNRLTEKLHSMQGMTPDVLYGPIFDYLYVEASNPVDLRVLGQVMRLKQNKGTLMLVSIDPNLVILENLEGNAYQHTPQMYQEKIEYTGPHLWFSRHHNKPVLIPDAVYKQLVALFHEGTDVDTAAMHWLNNMAG